ncbi:MAG: hypothetical protein LH615_07340 [Ferruginibacter sp.]|nr:hypothetical protein [Ferruginibacter sp.]
MKLLGILLLALIVSYTSNAQHISSADGKFLLVKEDSLKTVALKIVQGRNASDRFFADSAFTRIFVRALRTKNSFYHPFDSIINISKLYAPDSSFKIFTWQLMINENTIRQHGAIQMKTADGSFKVFPLIDKSDVIINQTDTIADNKGWMGAVYYKIIQKEYKERTYYTLLGFDENNIKSDKKIMDVLEFVNGQPVFGNKIFVIENSNNYQKEMARYILEYKKEAAARLTFDRDLDAVVFDELTSETNTPNKKWTLVPDGEYQGFLWKNGKWVLTTNLFNGAPPKKYTAEKTIRDAKGTIDETKVKGGEPEIINNPPN